MIIIGDIHGKYASYHRIIRNLKQDTIQLGDFGFKESHEWHRANVDPERHKVLFGNHDYYPMFNEPHSLGDFSYKNGLMTIRGAKSFDRAGTDWVWKQVDKETKKLMLETAIRLEGVDLFEWQEEMGHQKSEEVIDSFIEHRPSIVVSHDCPSMVREAMMETMGRELRRTRTDQMLQACLEHHQPDLWVFGHYHKSFDRTMNGTRFVCLEELEVMEL